MSTPVPPPDDPDAPPISVTTPGKIDTPAQKEQVKLTVDPSGVTPAPAVIRQPAKPTPVTVTKPEAEEKQETKKERQHAQAYGPGEDEDSFKFTARMLFRTLLSAGTTVGAIGMIGAGVALTVAGGAVRVLSGGKIDYLWDKGVGMLQGGIQGLKDEHADTLGRFQGIEVPVDKRSKPTPPSPIKDELGDKLENAEAESVRLQRQEVGRTDSTPQFVDATRTAVPLQQVRQDLDAQAQATKDDQLKADDPQVTATATRRPSKPR